MALSFSDISIAAEGLGIEPCIIKAVVDVESSGKGFSEDGRIVIQFEGHVFYAELKKRGFDVSGLTEQYQGTGVIYPRFDRAYVQNQTAEYRQLSQALKIHDESALLSTSWGLFQIMGFNFRACGFNSVHDFVTAQKESEANQLTAFCEFVRSQGHLPYLRKKDWAGFARRYNGPLYAENQYDTKMQGAYERCKNSR